MFNKFGKRAVSAAVVVCVSAALSGCFWDSSDDGAAVATANLTVPAAASSLAAVVNTAYTFPAVTEFGTTSATTVTFSSATATPSFSISSAEGTASGATTFGSCIFTVTASTFPSTSPLALGKVVTVHPCELQVLTAGVVVGATSASLGTRFILGQTPSSSVFLAATLDANGQLTIGNVSLGTVPVAAATGATGGGG
jgi:hypothetical protein